MCGGSSPSAEGVLGCSGSGVLEGDCTAFSEYNWAASFCAFPLEIPHRTVAVEAALDGPAASQILQTLHLCFWSGATINLKQHALHLTLKPSAQIGLDSQESQDACCTYLLCRVAKAACGRAQGGTLSQGCKSALAGLCLLLP